MAEFVILTPSAARKLIHGALIGAGTSRANAGYFTEAILDTELSGLEGHGFYWLQYYCAHVESGKVNGRARPRVEAISASAFRVDARCGFAHPAIEAGFRDLIPAAKAHGVAVMGVFNSYNAATLGYHTGTLARAGLVGLGATNSPPVIAPVGGYHPVIGTNPLSLAVPGISGEIAFLIDQSASTVTWTAVKRAAEEGRSIPIGWARDAQGRDTTDPGAGITGSLTPAGGVKGFSIGLIVEVLCAALAGGNLGPDIGSFTDNDGKRVCNGQFFMAFSPEKLSGGVFADRISQLAGSIRSQAGARMPNDRREANKARLSREGLCVDRELYERLTGYASRSDPAAAT